MMHLEDDLAVCRDESCELEDVHPPHLYSLKPIKGGRPAKPWYAQTEPGAYRRPDPDGLTESLKKAFATDFPLAFVDLRNYVINDYGSVSNRAMHRHIRSLIDEDFVLELDLQLTYSAYLRRGSRYENVDRGELREFMLGQHAHRKKDRKRDQYIQPGPILLLRVGSET